MISKERLTKHCQSIRRNSFAVCCGLAPILILFALLLTFDFGCNVIVNGEIIGTAKSKDCVYELIDNINQNFAPYFKDGKAITVKPATTPKLVIKGHFTPEDELGEKLKQTCPYLKKAYCVKSNGVTVVALSSEKERDSVYGEFINQYTDSASYEIYDDIAFTYESVPYGMIKSRENALKMLDRTYSFNETVDIPQNTSFDEILVKYNITESDFKKLNPSYSEGKAQKVKIESEIPYIRVVTNTSVNEKTILKYRTRSVDDSTMYEGETKVSSMGTDGLKTTSKIICKINGETIFEKTVKEEITDAVDEIVLVGTKKYSKGKATGTFANPYAGKLSSRFGQRGSRQHKGIDICGNIGDSIEASDGGEVVYADWEQGYGLVVKINHQNGYTTFYAHCDKLFVKAGDKVSKGDVIAALGNTGNSTGPHLHFEIRKTKDNTPLDPLTYIDIIKDENNN